MFPVSSARRSRRALLAAIAVVVASVAGVLGVQQATAATTYTFTVSANIPTTITINGRTVSSAANASASFAAGTRFSVSVSALATDGVSKFVSWGDTDNAGWNSRTRTFTMPARNWTMPPTYFTAIEQRMDNDAAARSALGYQTDTETGPANLRWTGYQNGRVIWTKASGVHYIKGAIMVHYDQTGGVSNVGVPVTDEGDAAGGKFTHFTNDASIYWSPATGPEIVRGLIRQKYASLGWERSFLGFPTSDELHYNGGAMSHFQGGSIYWSPATGAHSINGTIRNTYASMGWENSYLRFPTSDEYAIAGGRRSDFQGGYITWSATTGVATPHRY